MKRTHKAYILLSLVLSLFLSLLQPLQQTYAQSVQLDVVVSPSVSFLKLQPGSTAVYTVTVENTAPREVTLQPLIVDFQSDNLTGIPVLQNSLSFPYFDDADSLPALTLQPGASAQAKLNITVPAGAPNAEYPMTILFETPQDTIQTQVGQIGSQAQVGSNLIVLVTNDEQTTPNISINSLQAEPIIDSFHSIQFSPLIQNNNFSGVIASGSAKIRNWRGTTLSEYDLPPQVILGNSSRGLLALDPDAAPIPGLTTEDTALVSPEYDPAFLLGPYWIETTIRAEGSEAPLVVTSSRVVIAVPFAVLIGISVVVLLWLGYVWYEKKKSF